MSFHTDLVDAGLPVQGTAVEGLRPVFDPPLTAQQEVTYQAVVARVPNRQANARIDANTIPDWATWTIVQATDYLDTNIGTPLATPIPANPMTVQQIRAVLVSIVSIMVVMLTVLKALAKMVISLRNYTRIIE